MKNPQIVTLENGTVLCIEKDQVTYEPCAPGDKFTVSMQRVVIELARNLNRYVPYEQLHEVYEGRACEDMGRNLQRMKEKMPPAIKGAIKTKNGLKDPTLQALLQTGTDGILPLRVTPIEDNYWYNWFMSE